MIYYGDEVAMEGDRDPDCRRGMLWKEEYQDKNILKWYQTLIAIRKEYPCITSGKLIERKTDDDNGILKIARELDDEKVTIIFNCKNGDFKVDEYIGVADILNDIPFDGLLKAYGVAVLVDKK